MKPLVLPLSFALLAGLLAGCAYPDPIVLAEWDRVADSEILVRALRDGPADSRVRAARAMGRIQSEAYAAPLSSAAGDPDPEVRSAAVFALGQLGLAVGATPTDDAVETCRQVARSAAAATAAGGVECLGKLAREGALPDVLALAGHRDARVREEVAHALMRYRFVPVWRGEVEDPPPFSQEGVRTLVGALADSDVRVRRAAAHALSRYGEPRAVADLVHASGDPDPWVRLFAVRGVGRSGDPASASRIAPRLDDAVPGVRAEAVAALAGLDRADLVGDGARRDPSFHVRAAAATALAGSRDETASEALRDLAGDPSPTVRAAALEALAARAADRDDDVAAASLLRGRFEEEIWPVRVAAVRAAAVLGESGGAIVEAAAADADPRVRTAAVEGLRDTGRLRSDHAALLAALESDDLGLLATSVAALAEAEPDDLVPRLAAVYDRSGRPDRIEVRGAVLDAAPDSAAGLALVRRIAARDPAAALRRRAARRLEAEGEPTVPVEAFARYRPPFDRLHFRHPPVVVLETSRGELEIELFDLEAPLHVSSFVGLVRRGFYDGLPWHRVVPNFVIQGGDPQGSGWGGPGYSLPDEIHPERYRAGTVGMPKAGKDTGGCQIFITHLPTPHLDGNYTVFGRVVSGLEVVDRIEIGDRIVRAYEVGGRR